VIAISVVLWVLGIVVVATGIAALFGLLAPNRFVGIRTAEALKNEETFRLANKIAAPTTILAGALIGAAGLTIHFIGGVTGAIVAIIAIITAVVVAGFGATVGSRAAKAKASVGVCGQSCGGCSLRDACESPTAGA
jgi:uncharacterized membrane protein